MKNYHKLVQRGITIFGKPHLENELLSVQEGGTIMRIYHPTNKDLDPLTFQPDRIFTLNDKSKIIFQVLGAQARKNREIEADIFRVFLCSGILKLIFITPSKESAENVDRIAAIVQKTLEIHGTRKAALPTVLTIVVPETTTTPEVAAGYLIKVEKEIFKRN